MSELDDLEFDPQEYADQLGTRTSSGAATLGSEPVEGRDARGAPRGMTRRELLVKGASARRRSRRRALQPASRPRRSAAEAGSTPAR
jgi:hypothetical protein